MDNLPEGKEYHLVESGVNGSNEPADHGYAIPAKPVAKEQTRIRINFTVSAKGQFQPDITSEAETVETAMRNLDDAHAKLGAWAKAQGLLSD